jgi:protein-arginine kinase activator protein McsA
MKPIIIMVYSHPINLKDVCNDCMQELLNILIKTEDYEKACIVRDEINRRKEVKLRSLELLQNIEF